MSLKRKHDDLTERISLKWHLSMPLTFFLFSIDLTIVSSNGKFVSSDWISKDAIKRFGSWLRISLQNQKKSSTVYSLFVNCFNISTKKFTRLQLQEPISNRALFMKTFNFFSYKAKTFKESSHIIMKIKSRK